MGIVWTWAALSLLLTYLFILSWGEWWQYVLGAGAIAALCFAFAAMMARDARAGREDATMLKLARYLTLGQLAGMIIAMIGLIIDDKMPRDPQEPDWAASAIFFFGAAALAAISANALRSPSTRN
jgi:drug/metabolite transporter (DMT)-like permease